MFTDLLDIVAIQQWRAACRATYAHATRSLRRTLTRLLLRFVPQPGALLSILSRFRGAIGGITAIAFLLRDAGLRCNVLQIYTASRMYVPFVEGLRRCPSNSKAIAHIHVGKVTRTFMAQRDINAFASIQLVNGLHIIVYRSCTITPLSGIVLGGSSALMNFVTEHSFGCAYPRLTLNRRALLCDHRLEHFSDADHVVMDTLLAGGFGFAISAGAWPGFHGNAEGIDDDGENSVMPCYRGEWVCPHQARFFGDGGSMVTLMDPLGPDVARARFYGVPPFGPMVMWRLLSSFECAAKCGDFDELLHKWIISTPVLTLPCPFPLSFTTRIDPPRESTSNIGRRRARSV